MSDVEEGCCVLGFPISLKDWSLVELCSLCSQQVQDTSYFTSDPRRECIDWWRALRVRALFCRVTDRAQKMIRHLFALCMEFRVGSHEPL
jgi:hypothetical protein